MACFHPLKAFYRYDAAGKKKITFYKWENCLKPYEDFPDDNKISIPCGQCAGCRLEYSRQWAIRCMLEAQQYEHNYFVTLTYDNEHLPRKQNPFFSHETGEVLYFYESSPLVPEDVKQFMKILRRRFEYRYNFIGIRFFGCGEYGEKFMRPHYHLILFNCPIPDLDLLKTSFNGDVYWKSDMLSDIWKKGFVCVATCNFDTCAYVARYMMKKQKGKNSNFYDDIGLVAPFSVMSRDPGIAKSYYDKNKDKIYNYDSLNIVDKNGVAMKVKPPRYYDRLYDIESPDDLKRIKGKREESAKNALERKLEHTDLTADEYLQVQEDVFLSKIEKLVRPIE